MKSKLTLSGRQPDFKLQILAFFFIGFLLLACNGNPVPKPRAYFRIDLPEHAYRSFDSTFPYAFDIPVYAIIEPDKSQDAEPYWANIDYPAFNARIHLSYKPIQNNLQQYLEDSYKMAMKHMARSSGIRESLYKNPENAVFASVYDIKGIGAASPLQFFATDSSTHFLRGALYFNMTPNNDSLMPVITFIEKDIRHLLETLHWK